MAIARLGVRAAARIVFLRLQDAADSAPDCFCVGLEALERGAWKFTLGGATRTLVVVGACLFLVFTWQAGVKKETRRAYDADEVGSDPVERVTLFVSHAVNAVPVVLNETETVFEGLVARVCTSRSFRGPSNMCPRNSRTPMANCCRWR